MSPTAPRPETALLADLVEQLGSETFPQAFLEWINTRFRADHLGIDLLLPQLKLRSIGRGTLSQLNLHKLMSIYYRDNRFANVDPAIAMAANRFGRQQLPFLLNLSIDHIDDPGYRRDIFERFHIAQRIMIGDRCRNLRFWIKLLRHDDLGVASGEEMAQLEEIRPLILSLARWHLIISQRRMDAIAAEYDRPRNSQTLLAQLGPRLSNREIDVCARILSGMTGPQIATDLRIKPSSVATLRRRAYAKLEINSTAELFSLCTQRQLESV